QQFQPDQGGGETADEEHGGNGDQVEDGDALMIGGEEPGLDAVVGVQIVLAFHRCGRDGSHNHCLGAADCCALGAAGTWDGEAARLSTASRCSDTESDLM